jgi:hypothetical protein
VELAILLFLRFDGPPVLDSFHRSYENETALFVLQFGCVLECE